ncbi:MAG: hypothetical protein RDU20_21570 [Desulfomonilaceae bacterium]|nr:hypothetical protein [Desulfomonilaceae bacterium]
MRSRITIALLSMLLIACLSMTSPALSRAEAYEALKGVDAVKVVFDFRNAKPEAVLDYLTLIQLTYKDEAVTRISPKPDFVVAFMGPSVKLLSTNREGFSPEEQKTLDKIAGLILQMGKDGVRFEICLFAVKHFGLEPQAVIPGIEHVQNGWISSFGYQARGYGLIPVF